MLLLFSLRIQPELDQAAIAAKPFAERDATAALSHGMDTLVQSHCYSLSPSALPRIPFLPGLRLIDGIEVAVGQIDGADRKHDTSAIANTVGTTNSIVITLLVIPCHLLLSRGIENSARESRP
jgi:hypothetical protein